MLTTTRVDYSTGLIIPPSTLGSTTSLDINTAGDLTSSFSSPLTIAQGTEEDLSALEKVEKLKTQ